MSDEKEVQAQPKPGADRGNKEDDGGGKSAARKKPGQKEHPSPVWKKFFEEGRARTVQSKEARR
jgi:hypothetical protein